MKRESGFSVMEILVLVVVLGVLAAITIPKFRLMLHQSREGRTKAHLGDLRGALAIYYSDNFGLYPSDADGAEAGLTAALVPQYLKAIPEVELFHHHFKKLNTVQSDVNDAGNWVYATHRGFIAVNCTHLDTKGMAVSNW